LAQVGRLGAEAVILAADEIAPPAKRGGAASDLDRGEGDMGLAVACPCRPWLVPAGFIYGIFL